MQKDCKRKEGCSRSRELLRLRLLDDSEVDCTVSVWGETAKALSQKPLPGSAIAMYRLKLKVDGNSKELTTAEDSYILLLDSADGVSQREDMIIQGKETILGAGAKSCATMYEGSADVSGELRVICLRSLALAAEMNIQLQELCDAHVVLFVRSVRVSEVFVIPVRRNRLGRWRPAFGSLKTQRMLWGRAGDCGRGSCCEMPRASFVSSPAKRLC